MGLEENDFVHKYPLQNEKRMEKEKNSVKKN
jgi:hypothetical protein